MGAGEPIKVAVNVEHATWLQEELQDQAERVEFIDLLTLGRNPARIIPVWQQFASAAATDQLRPSRCIAEPVWPGQHPEEVAEGQLHDALMNLAVAPDTRLWMLCSYDADALSPAVLEEAQATHPIIVETGTSSGSTRYAGLTQVDALVSAEPPDPAVATHESVFTTVNVARLASYVKLELYVCGLTVDRAVQLATATNRVVLSRLHRDAATVTVRMWRESHAVIAEVSFDAVASDPLRGRRLTPEDTSESLCYANALCDLVQMRTTPGRTTVRMYVWS